MKIIAFTYEVQLGKTAKGHYKTEYTFAEDNTAFVQGKLLHGKEQAKFYFCCINIGNGYKKRLVRIDGDGKKVILATVTS